MKYDLIIFDCDGTLVDTEVVINSACSEVLLEMGYPQYTVEYCVEHFASLGLPIMLEVVAKEIGSNFDSTQFISRVRDKCLYNISRLVRPMPNAEILLRRLKNKHMKICVASNGEQNNVIEALRATHLYGFFDNASIFTYGHVGVPKPAPDLFLYAAKQMGGFSPERCLVIEDSDTGVQAAKAAGMDVLVVQAYKHPRQEKIKQLKPTAIIKDLSEVEGYIYSL
ncbi:MAG: HAD family phosphatase [Proteobacteria bacterium]|nr:HAD family phosphatase [Pseudomonadota bacterium]